MSIFSHEKARFTFENYNVIVGHHASGKTNFYKILRFLTFSLNDSPLMSSLEEISLAPKLKLDPARSTSLHIDLLLSDTLTIQLYILS